VPYKVDPEDFFKGAGLPGLEALVPVAEAAVATVQTLFKSEGPLASSKLRFLVSNEQFPWTAWPPREGTYDVWLTRPPNEWAFAFELTHELGHIMVGPARTNGAIEALVTAISFEAVRALGYTGYIDDFVIPTDLRQLSPEAERQHKAQRWDGLRALVAERRDRANELESRPPKGIRELQERRSLRVLGAVLLLSGPIDWSRFLDFAHKYATPSLGEDGGLRCDSVIYEERLPQDEMAVLGRLAEPSN
jgi:hypothetical protein